jgi:hypothetical protein
VAVKEIVEGSYQLVNYNQDGKQHYHRAVEH